MKTGQPLTLSCKVKDSPGLSVKWFRNGCEIISNYRQLLCFSNLVASLEVIDSSMEDSGEYVCVASSVAGSDHCSCTVTVKGWFNLFMSHVLMSSLTSVCVCVCESDNTVSPM